MTTPTQPTGHDRLIEALRSGLQFAGGPVAFDMNEYMVHGRTCENEKGEVCQTAACLAGHATFLLGREDEAVWSPLFHKTNLAKLLGLPYDEDNDNCQIAQMATPEIDHYPISTDKAIKMLKIHRDEGVVDWSRAAKEIGEEESDA